MGWRLSDLSFDHRSLLISCFWADLILDTFYHVYNNMLQVVDPLTLTGRATIPLSKRSKVSYAIFHAAGTTTVAVLEDGTKLKLYSLADPPQAGTP